MLGGSMSSRLFQNVREKRGLAYSVFSSLSTYRDTGAVTIYAGCANDAVGELVDVVMGEVRRLKAEPLVAGELRRAKDHLKGSLMLGLESTSSRMTHLARQEIYGDTGESLDDMLVAIDAVTDADVARVAQRLFPTGTLSLTVLGGGTPATIEAEQLALA
jgi:predicted Zn-dependent peptidase